MAIKVSANENGDVSKIIEEIQQPNIKAVIFFYSNNLKEKKIHDKFTNAFPGAYCAGCSMIGGWASTGPIEKGITAMSLSNEEVEKVFISFEEDVKNDPKRAANRIINDIKMQLGKEKTLNPNEYIGLILIDGLCLGEIIMKELTSAVDFSIPIVGGAAADELKFEETLVSYNNKQSGDAVLLMVLQMKVPFYFNHYVHYVPTDKEFLITKAEPEKRIVWEINNKPAAEYYANELGLKSVDDIEHIHFSTNPLGVVIGDAVYTRSPNHVIDGKGLQFYCFIEAGTKMSLLKKSNIILNANNALKDAQEHLENISGALLFNCVLRYLEMKDEKKLNDFNNVFSNIPFIGFNTYGEELFTHHNQTLTAIFFGDK